MEHERHPVRRHRFIGRRDGARRRERIEEATVATFSGTFHSDVSIRATNMASCATSTEIITTFATGYWTRYNPSSGVTRMFQTANIVNNRWSMLAVTDSLIFTQSSYLYSSGWTIRQIDLTTNITSTAPIPTAGSRMTLIRKSASEIITALGVFDLTMLAYSPSFTGLPLYAMMTYAGGRLFVTSGTSLSELSLSTGSVINTWTFAAPSFTDAASGYDGQYNRGGGAVIGSKIYFGSTNTDVAFVGLDMATNTVFHEMRPLGMSTGSAWRAYTDGLLYDWGNYYATVLDPVTMRWEVVYYPDLPTTVLPAYPSGSAFDTVWFGGKIWVPSTKPT